MQTTIRFQLPEPLESGELIGSRYRLTSIAGAGGMATVWRAYDERLRRPVAIKVISDELSTDPLAVARFAREARTHAGIQHPNLVQVFDYSVTAVQPYLVMEHISGSTLSERLDDAPFSAAELRALAFELLSAVACVHSHGVLHRDIKTGNVLLDKDGHARLTDFGLARLEDAAQITGTNEVVGTLRFLAPELIEGKPASRHSDLYALGVLLRTVARYGEPEPSMRRLIGWLTARDPEARPGDAHEALALLRGPERAKPAPRRQRAPRSTKHRSGAPRSTTQRSPRPRRNSRHSASPTRFAGLSALLVVIALIAFAVIDAGSSPAARPAAASRTRASRPTPLSSD